MRAGAGWLSEARFPGTRNRPAGRRPPGCRRNRPAPRPGRRRATRRRPGCGADPGFRGPGSGNRSRRPRFPRSRRSRSRRSCSAGAACPWPASTSAPAPAPRSTSSAPERQGQADLRRRQRRVPETWQRPRLRLETHEASRETEAAVLSGSGPAGARHPVRIGQRRVAAPHPCPMDRPVPRGPSGSPASAPARGATPERGPDRPRSGSAGRARVAGSRRGCFRKRFRLSLRRSWRRMPSAPASDPAPALPETGMPRRRLPARIRNRAPGPGGCAGLDRRKKRW